ncbi:MAG: elongation factor G [Thermoleophilia bacterium]
MAHESPDMLRNVAVLGHRGCGKTSLVEAMLFAAGETTRRGQVSAGSTVADFEEEEKRRGMSISAALTNAHWKGVKVNLLDTPGEPSFHADTLSVLPAVDAVVMVVNAASGVELQTRRLWQRCGELGLPRLVVVNMLDRERASFTEVAAALREMDSGCIPFQIPIGENGDLRGVVSLGGLTATTYAGEATGTAGDVPADLMDAARAAREALVEAVAETDDDLIERYLAGEEITDAMLVEAVRSGVHEARVFPVLCTSAEQGLGADRVLDIIVEELPSPAAARPRTVTTPEGDQVPLTFHEDGPAVAYCFKTLADQFSGRINLLRNFGGALHSDSQAHGPGDTKERVGQLFTLNGKDHVPLTDLAPGDIGAVAKLKELHTGQVLVSDGPVPTLAAPDMPPPVMSFSVTAAEHTDEDKLYQALRRLCDEDPTLDVHREEETGDLIVGGLSQLHVEVTGERLQRRFGVGFELHPPHVPYRETITAQAKAEGKHKKQTGGHGQFADCWLRVEPRDRGEGFEFVDEVVGGAIPRSFIPAVEKGVREAMKKGDLGGYPVVDVRVAVYDGKHHPVDSSEMAFKIAGSVGMKEALKQARPVLLEPVMVVNITVPKENVGDIMGDLSSRRGRPLGMEVIGEMEVVHAEVPMAEMLSYAPQLRAMTGGQGEYNMEFARYEEVPSHLVERAVAEEAHA